ncbi:hypothetical protein BDK51DRAFT_26935, partial [Blyttiomyces helicus]
LTATFTSLRRRATFTSERIATNGAAPTAAARRGSDGPSGRIDRALLSAISRSLACAGEDVGTVLPLLNSVLPAEIEETKQSMALGPRARLALLGALVVRLVNRITEVVPLTVMIDNAQWMDSGSWDLTLQIIRRCEKALVVLSSSPATDWRAGHLAEVSEMKKTVLVRLVGLDREESELVVLRKFGVRARKIDTELMDFVYERTQGRPIFLDSLATIMSDIDCLTVEEGELKAFIPLADVANRLPSSPTEAFLAQYDRNPSPEFRRLLRCASILGTSFTMEEVSSIWREFPNALAVVYTDPGARTTASTRYLSGLALAYDEFDILFPGAPPEAEDPNFPFTTVRGFRSAAARRAISAERMSTAERQIRHVQALALYEAIVTDATETVFVPPICYHLGKAALPDHEFVLKRIRYLGMMAAYMIVSPQTYREAMSVLRDQREVVETGRLVGTMGPISRCWWRAEFAVALTSLRECSPAEAQTGIVLALEAMNLLGLNWPKSPAQWGRVIGRQAFGAIWRRLIISIFPRRWGASSGRVAPLEWTPPVPDRRGGLFRLSQVEIEREERLSPLLQLVSVLMHTVNTRMRDRIASDLLALNFAYRTGIDVPRTRARINSSLSVSLWFSGMGWGANMAHKVAFSLQNSLDVFDPLMCVTSSIYLVASGRWTKGMAETSIGMSAGEKAGAFDVWLGCSGLKSFMLIYDGKLLEALNLEHTRLRESTLDGDHRAAFECRVAIAHILILRGHHHAIPAEVRERLAQPPNPKQPDFLASLELQLQGISSYLELRAGRPSGSIRAATRASVAAAGVYVTHTHALNGVLLAALSLARLAVGMRGGGGTGKSPFAVVDPHRVRQTA